MENKLSMVPEKLEKLQQAIAESNNSYDSWIQLKPLKESVRIFWRECCIFGGSDGFFGVYFISVHFVFRFLNLWLYMGLNMFQRELYTYMLITCLCGYICVYWMPPMQLNACKSVDIPKIEENLQRFKQLNINIYNLLFSRIYADIKNIQKFS